jgi:integrase
MDKACAFTTFSRKPLSILCGRQLVKPGSIFSLRSKISTHWLDFAKAASSATDHDKLRQPASTVRKMADFKAFFCFFYFFVKQNVSVARRVNQSLKAAGKGAMEKLEPISSDMLKKYLKTLNALSGPKFALLAYLGVETGLRTGDLLRVTYRPFCGLLGAFKIKEQKTGKFNLVTLTEPVKKAVQDYQQMTGSKESDFIFASDKNKQEPMHRSTVYRHLTRAGKACGLKRIGPHSLRKTFAQQLYLDSNGDLKLVQKKLNHKNEQTTLFNYLMTEKTTKDILDATTGIYKKKAEKQ